MLTRKLERGSINTKHDMAKSHRRRASREECKVPKEERHRSAVDFEHSGHHLCPRAREQARSRQE
jgi:hypothetical protein